MPKYNVVAHFESIDKYTVEADSEEEAIEKAQLHWPPEEYRSPGDITYVRDADVECVDWDAREEA